MREHRAQEEKIVHMEPNTTTAMIGDIPTSLARDKAAMIQDGRTRDDVKEDTRISVGRDQGAKRADRSRHVERDGFQCSRSMGSSAKPTMQHGSVDRPDAMTLMTKALRT